MFSKIRHTLLLLICISISVDVSADPVIKTSKYKFDVEIRPGVVINTTVDIYSNTLNTSGKSYLCLHGFAHTSDTYKSMLNRVIYDEAYGQEISRFILIDLPGRGKTSTPDKKVLLFGELNLDDYAMFLSQVLSYLQAQQLTFDTFIAHSMGTMVVQIIQNSLIQQGSSLADEYNITEVFLLAPVLPREINWQFADSGIGLQLALSYVETDGNSGTFINIPAEQWINLFFINSSGSIILDAPTTAEVISNNFNSIESSSAALQMLSDPSNNIERPSIDNGIFNNTGSTLNIISFSEDTLIFANPVEHQNLYTYLTGDSTMSNLHVITDSQAIHDHYLLETPQLDNVLFGVQ